MADKNEKVTWGQLGIFITIVSTIFVGLVVSLTTIKNEITDIKVDVATTKTDVGWLRSEWEKMTGQGEISNAHNFHQGTLLDKMYDR